MAEVADYAMFPARTKTHRLLRAYILTAGLTTVARNIGMGTADDGALSGKLRAALEIQQEAYDCLYPDRTRLNWKTLPSGVKALHDINVSEIAPIPCIFFDERMARLDYALYKFAAEVMVDEQSRVFFADIRDRLVGELPVVGKALRTVSRASEAAKEATATVYETTSLVDSIINFSFIQSKRYIYLAPIYRDALEFDMRLVLDALRERCAADTVACSEFERGRGLFDDGDGDLGEWRGFLRSVTMRIDAYPVHFAVVTRWLNYACAGIYSKSSLTPGRFDEKNYQAAITTVEKALDEHCSPLIEYVKITDSPPFRRTFKIAYKNPRKDNNKSDEPHEINAIRAPDARPTEPAERKVPSEAEKARGQQPQ